MSLDIYPTPAQSVLIGGVQADAFGRQRVSNPETLFDSKQLFDSQPLFWDDQAVSGAGTASAHDPDQAATTISVTHNVAGSRVRQTFMRFNYQPGKSQLILMTGQMEDISSATGISGAIGLFDDENGVFASLTPSGISLTIRSYTSGSAVDNTIAQANWNGDKLDGTGPSGFTIDPTACQIYWVDMEWLGVGSIRTGFIINGQIILCHTFHHANTVSTVYMTTPNLPLRYEVVSAGTGGDATVFSMQHICSTVISEGGSQQLGYNRWASTGGTHIDAATENLIYAVVGIRLKSTHLEASVSILGVEIAEHAGSKSYEWLLLLDPTVEGTFTYASLGTDAAVDYATGATANTVTNGTQLEGGFASSANKGGTTIASIENALRLGSYIDGTPTEMVLCARPIGGSSNIDIEGGISFRQIT